MLEEIEPLCCFHSNVQKLQIEAWYYPICAVSTAMFHVVSYLQFKCDLFFVFAIGQVLCDKDRTPKKVPHVTGLQHTCLPCSLSYSVIPHHNTRRTNNCFPQIQQAQVMGHLERRVLEVNRKRIKVVKPGSKTSFPTTEVRGTYAPPFHVSYYFKFSR